jgi:hypothetical protein
VAVIAVVARFCLHGSLVIPGRQSQTVDVAAARPVLTAAWPLLAGEPAVDEHAAMRKEAASSPAATAASLDRQVTCISFISCSMPLDGR